jgi:ABC-type lipoprotein release transport system permease subunit
MIRNISLAWRNLWRNKRRTLITVASVFFGVLLGTLISSVNEGAYNSMIGNIVKFYSGYIQIQNVDYWENKTINETMEPSAELDRIVESVPQITGSTMRLENFALASSDKNTKGAMIFGIDPDRENEVSEIKRWVEKGRYFEGVDPGVLVGSDLARYLNLSIGDTLVIIGSGYHGSGAAGKYPIIGLLRFPNPQLNKQCVYMHLSVSQELFSAENLVTAMILMVEEPYDLKPAMRKLKNRVPSEYAVLSWEEMNPELVQMIESDKAGHAIMRVILYILIGFGIFGTVMMMVVERTREMGVMVAIGMQKMRLAGLLFLETIMIGLIGVLAGFAGSIPMIVYFYNNPVKLSGNAAETMEQFGVEPFLHFSWIPSVFYEQLIIVFAIVLIISLYPLINALKLKVHQALRA